MSDDVALGVSAVYTAVSILADAVSTLPVVCYMRNDAGRTIVPSPPLIADPWPEGTQQDWVSQAMVSLALRGNFYGRIVDRDPYGFATMIQPLHPDSITTRRSGGMRRYWIDGRVVDTADVLHIPNLLIPGAYVGMNPVEYMRQSWGLAAAAERYGGQLFANSARPSGVLTSPEDLTEEETLELARAWQMNHKGLQGAGNVGVLTGGVTWQSISVNPDDAQFLQTRDFQRVEIGGMFRIPPHMMGHIDRTPQAPGNEELEMNFVTNTLMSYITKIESYLNKLMPGPIEARFDLSARLRGNQQARYTNYTLGINNGFLLADEARKAEDKDPLPDGQGQVVWRPLNFAPANKILDGTAMAGGTLPPGQGGQGGGLDQNPDGGGAAPNPPNNPKAPVDGSP